MTDKLPPRKYFTEIAINLCTSTVLLLPPDQLYNTVSAELAAILAECHIYLICRRPVLSFDPNTLAYTPSRTTGHFVRKIGGSEQRIRFTDNLRPPVGGRLEVDSYPHRILKGFDENGKPLDLYWPANLISMHADIEDSSIREFEVVYVGQAFGDGTRSAFDRLRSHSTLQRILAESAARRPDDELMLFLFKYAPYQAFFSMDGITKEGMRGDEDKEHYTNILKNPLSEKQQIGLAEAGLIRYFAPEYNELYKDSFPHERLKILDDCYKLDFAGLIVEIDTEDVHAPIWSPAARKGVHHIAQFDLHDPETRRSFFSIVDRQGRYALTDVSGPTY